MINPQWKEWKACWIAHRNSHNFPPSQPYLEEGERNAYYLFRKEFSLAAILGKALLSITGSSMYRLWINGNSSTAVPSQAWCSNRYYTELNEREFLLLQRDRRRILCRPFRFCKQKKLCIGEMFLSD